MQYRGRHQGAAKGDGDPAADQRVDLGALLGAAQISRQRHQRRGDRTRPLQHAPGNHRVDGLGRCGDDATDAEQQESSYNDRFTTHAVRP